MGQIAKALEDLTGGKIDTGQAADRIRRCKLAARQPAATGFMSLGQDDPTGVAVEDDGHEISDAYHDGKITNEQYGVLAGAAAEAGRRGKR